MSYTKLDASRLGMQAGGMQAGAAHWQVHHAHAHCASPVGPCVFVTVDGEKRA